MSGPQCCSNPLTLNPGSGVSHVEEVAGLKTYVSGSLDFKLAVLFVSDVLGEENNSKEKVQYISISAGKEVAYGNE
ncbi:hypothetical protein CCACVL1_28912 [Corchorus capsularis]|uniref:Uncharacterized protein n=1 Tax=Corchorus capsularis TaxID=210143 RepID=A0A1R3G4Q5_COCAP|nr:hypothetical protein CCACVL1_28912 [Corchorus capsularis]